MKQYRVSGEGEKRSERIYAMYKNIVATEKKEDPCFDEDNIGMAILVEDGHIVTLDDLADYMVSVYGRFAIEQVLESARCADRKGSGNGLGEEFGLGYSCKSVIDNIITRGLLEVVE